MGTCGGGLVWVKKSFLCSCVLYCATGVGNEPAHTTYIRVTEPNPNPEFYRPWGTKYLIHKT